MKCYVCVLSTDEYLDGVLILSENLKHLGAHYELLCLVNENITKDSRKTLENFNIKTKNINKIKFGKNSYDVSYSIHSHWKNTFDKLNVFSLTEYEKIVYLDSDLLILENIDNLFNEEHITMSRDLPWHYDKFNSGIMVLEPNMDDYNNLIKIVKKKDEQNEQIGDQDIINEYFKDIKPLPFGYNMVRLINTSGYNSKNYFGHYDDVTGTLEKRYSVDLRLNNNKNSKVIHYINTIKPFMLKQKFDDPYTYLYLYYLNRIETKKNNFKSKEKLISIVIPIYNKEKYLKRTLDSVVNQTHKNLEIILIDDDSTDNSLKICEEYRKKDKRIIIYKKTKNEGVSAARNIGLEIAKGEYIGFVDADDYIKENMYEKLINNIMKYDVDFVQCGLEYNGTQKSFTNDKELLLYNNQNAIEFYLNGDHFSGTIWNKLFKKDFIKDMYFCTDYKKHEDILFEFNAVKRANKILLINDILYYYTYQKNDSLTGDFSCKKDKGFFDYIDNMTKFITKYYPQLKEKLVKKVINKYYYFLIGQLRKNKIPRSEKKITKIMMQNLKTFTIKNKNIIGLYSYEEMIYGIEEVEIKLKYE